MYNYLYKAYDYVDFMRWKMRDSLKWIVTIFFVISFVFGIVGCKEPEIQVDTTAPAEVKDFKICIENEIAYLSWKNPPDSDFAGVQISMIPAEGILANPISLGKEVSNFSLSGLRIGFSYTIKIKTYDKNLNYSSGVSSVVLISANDSSDEKPNENNPNENPPSEDNGNSSVDKTAPGEVLNFVVEYQQEEDILLLSWDNPSDADFDGLELTMTPSEGSLISPILLDKKTTFYHLNNYTKEYNSEILHTFTLRTFDTSLNYSLGATGEIRIQKDNIPPTQVINLTASYSAMENTITVSWENPLDEDFAGVQIAYGKFGEDEINSFFVDRSFISYTITDILADDSEYLISVVPFDNAGNGGEVTTVSVSAIDNSFVSCDVKTGDYVLTNNTYVRKEYFSQLTPFEVSQICGVVCVMDSGEPVILGLDFPETEVMWAVPGTTGGNSYFTDIVTNVNKIDYEYTFTGDLDGSDNWEFISSIDLLGSQNAVTNYPSFYFANMYAAIAGLMGTDFADGWYVPSISELYEMSDSINVLAESLRNLDIYLPKICDAVDNEYYIRFWSSSQSNALDYSAYILEGSYDNYSMYGGVDFSGLTVQNVNRGNTNYVWVFHDFDARKIKPYDNYGIPEITSVTIPTVGENYTGKIPVTIYGNNLLSDTITSDNTSFTDIKYISNTEATATISNPGYIGEHYITVSCGDSNWYGTFNVALYDDYFKIVNIGGEGSAYKVAYPDNSEYGNSFYNATSICGDYNNYTGNFKSYIESLTFSDLFKEKYASIFNGDKVNIVWREFEETSYDINYAKQYDFTYLINQLTTLCTPAFEDMIETFLTNYEWILTGYNEYDCLKEYEFYVYYVTMILSSYNYGYSGTTYNDSKWSDYESSIEDDVIDLWNRLFSEEIFNTTPPIADIASDINNGCPLIVEQMNIHLAYAAEKMQVELNDLQNLLNLSFIIETLEPIGDTSENRNPGSDNPMIKVEEKILTKFFSEKNQ